MDISYAVFCLKKFFFNDTATTEIYTLSLHDALPISSERNVISSVDKKIAASERNVISSVDKKIAASERKILSVMDEKLSRSENMILNELDRVQAHLEGDLEKVQKNLEELKQFYKIDKLETDNTSLLLKMYNDMQKEIAEIKTKIA